MQSGPDVAFTATASTGLHPILTGPHRQGRVIGVFTAATYVLLPDGYVVAAVTPDGARLPNALVLAATSGELPFAGLRADSPAVVGGLLFTVGGLRIRVARWHPATPPSPSQRPVVDASASGRLADWLDRREIQLPASVRGGLDDLREQLIAGRLSEAGVTARGLIGLGPGLTPSGDDVLAGVLISLHRLDRAPLASEFAAILLPIARNRTTALSATLLQHAAAGESLPEAARLADALAGHGVVEAAAAELTRFGHTSGHDLAHGVLAGALIASALPSAASATTIEP